MKAPQNFAEKIKGYKYTTTYGDKHTLGDDGGNNSIMWVYPEFNARNVLRFDFDWDKEEYVVKAAVVGNGTNFHTTNLPKKIVKDYFTSFGAFKTWLDVTLADCDRLFNIKN